MQNIDFDRRQYLKPFHRKSGRLLLATVFIGLLLFGCGPRYATRQIDPSDVFRSYAANVLTSGSLRFGTLQRLRLLFLDREYEQAPVSVIEKLQTLHVSGEETGLLPVISELAYLEGQKQETQNLERAGAFYVMAAAHAYEYLSQRLGENSPALVSPISLFMVELYNSAVSRTMVVWQKTGTSWTDTLTLDLPHLRYSLSVSASGPKIWNPSYFDRFRPAYEIYIEGLRNIYRSHGLGASLIGIRENRQERPGYEEYYPSVIVHPVTSVIEFSVPEDSKSALDRTATLRFYDPLEGTSMRLGQRPFPLDTDYSASFGLLMTRIDPARYELKGLLYPDEHMDRAGIYMLDPFNPEKIPVLMIHGLYSSPATFIEMFNDLRGVPEIRRRYQFWYFFYPTGLPILESEAILRRELKQFRELFDPEGTSRAFSNMVVVGHSMGGILAQLLTQSSGNAIWDSHVAIPFDKMELGPEEKERARSAFFFESLPYVKRAVFIATPHQGSSIARPWVSRLASKLITLPSNTFLNSASFLSGSRNKRTDAESSDDIAATSVSQLAPESPFIRALSALPLSADVLYHSIIAVRNAETGQGSSDGVVNYESSHLEGAASEKLVPDSHSCLQHPLTIAEVRRILIDHLRSFDRQSSP